MQKPVIPLHLVKVGMKITPKILLNHRSVAQFKYASECDRVYGGLVAGIEIC
jgi:hypothetical protein